MQEAQDALNQAAADLAGNLGNKARLTLPTFDGKMDLHATRNFLDKVDGYAAVTRLNAAETAQAVAFAVVANSPADLWLTNLKERSPDDAQDWARLRPLMNTRFAPTLTASEKAAAVDGCTQGRHQEVPAFRDQCESVQLLLDREMDNALKTGGNADNYRTHFQGGILNLFLRGLRDEGGLKSHTNGALACVSLADFVNAATRYERHITKSIKVVVAGIDEDYSDNDDNDRQEIAALKAKQANRRQGGKKNTTAKRHVPATTAARPGTAPRLCWSCQSPDHMNRDCPVQKKSPFRGNKTAGGNNTGQAGYNHAAIVNEVVAKCVQSMMAPQALQYDQSSTHGSHSDRFSDVNSIHYVQQQQPDFY
jgi:hypothetical protein